MSRSALFNDEARQALVKGVHLVRDAVQVTMGPKGKTVVIQQKEGRQPVITKDGVSVAREIKPKDEKIAIGAQLVQSVAQKAMNEAGDGTTTATVLAGALVDEGMKYVASNANLNNIRKGIINATKEVVEKIAQIATPIENVDQLINIATISANGDEKLGKIVAEAYDHVGKDGIVTVEESKERDISLVYTEGMHLTNGWSSQYFVTDQKENSVEFDNPMIILSDKKLTNLMCLMQILEQLASKGTPIVIIADGFDTSTLNTLAMNKVTRGVKVACIDAPGFGERKTEILRDLGIYLGGKVGDDVFGVKLENMTVADLGTCEKIIIKKDETIIRGGKGNPEEIQKRVEEIKESMERTDAPYEKEKLRERLGALTTGVATIYVGGSSEEEIKELKDRLDDAMWSVKSALQEGYVPGAGRTLAYLSDSGIFSEPANEDEKIGVQILRKAMKAPFKTILSNADENADVIAAELKNKDITEGYDVSTMKRVNLIQNGVIDAAKVVRSSLQAATSIASLVLTTNVVITQDPEENKGLNLAAMMPGMM